MRIVSYFLYFMILCMISTAQASTTTTNETTTDEVPRRQTALSNTPLHVLKDFYLFLGIQKKDKDKEDKYFVRLVDVENKKKLREFEVEGLGRRAALVNNKPYILVLEDNLKEAYVTIGSTESWKEVDYIRSPQGKDTEKPLSIVVSEDGNRAYVTYVTGIDIVDTENLHYQQWKAKQRIQDIVISDEGSLGLYKNFLFAGDDEGSQISVLRNENDNLKQVQSIDLDGFISESIQVKSDGTVFIVCHDTDSQFNIKNKIIILKRDGEIWKKDKEVLLDVLENSSNRFDTLFLTSDETHMILSDKENDTYVLKTDNLLKGNLEEATQLNTDNLGLQQNEQLVSILCTMSPSVYKKTTAQKVIGNGMWQSFQKKTFTDIRLPLKSEHDDSQTNENTMTTTVTDLFQGAQHTMEEEVDSSVKTEQASQEREEYQRQAKKRRLQ